MWAQKRESLGENLLYRPEKKETHERAESSLPLFTPAFLGGKQETDLETKIINGLVYIHIDIYIYIYESLQHSIFYS